jgi:sulfotransferase family protein
MTPPVKVLFIAGSGRNGSTLLSNVLGQVEGFCSVGEVRYLWDRGVVENRHCGCGQRFEACPFWRDVLAHAFGAPDAVDGRDLLKRREAGLHSRHLLLPAAASRKLGSPAYRVYLDVTAKLYAAIQAVSGCRVIVDSSKFPSYQYVLETMPGLDVFTVHLVRDPRAVTYSYYRRRKPRSPFDGSELLAGRHPLTTALSWHEWNLILRQAATRHPDRYMVLRYEDFSEDPGGAIRRVLTLLGEPSANVPLVSEREVVLGTHHTVSGNPDRFKTGPTVIRPDDEWKEKMGYGLRAVVSALTWPERLRYQYVER